MNKAIWPELKELIASRVKLKTRDEWCQIFEESDIAIRMIASVMSVTDAMTGTATIGTPTPEIPLQRPPKTKAPIIIKSSK